MTDTQKVIEALQKRADALLSAIEVLKTFHGVQAPPLILDRRKRTFTVAAKQRMARAQRQRWAKAKQQGQKKAA